MNSVLGETEPHAVEVQSFTMRFGRVDVIKNLSFAIGKGEVFGLLGANGAGKTTTIRTLLGLLEPTSGKLLVNGERFDTSMSASVGYLPEERGLYRNEPVLSTMIYFGILHGLTRDEASSRALSYLQRVGLADKANVPIVKLSGGQQQKIQLGVTILHEPSLMILDEPTEALDPVNRTLLMDIIAERRERGATVVLVTHRMDEVEQLCDRILLLKDGTKALYGTIDEVKNKFGDAIIALNFTGELTPNTKLFKITKHLPHYAELARNKDASVDEVLRFLARDHQLHLTTFDLRRQSLNDIFLATYQGDEVKNG